MRQYVWLAWLIWLLITNQGMAAAATSQADNKPTGLSPATAVTSATSDQVLKLARQVMVTVRYAALATVDGAGQPRTRIVDAFPPDDDFVVWVATRPNTRKVQQIQENPRVTLFYFDAAGRNYVSLMGSATLVDDEATKRRMRRSSDSDRIYPDFPADYLLIRIEPQVVEGLLPGFRGDSENWQPARVEFEADVTRLRHP